MRGEVFLQGLIAFLIVAFGQPSFAPWLGPIAASLGYALFWRAIRIYPFRKQRFWRSFLWYASVSLIQLSWMSSIEYQGIYMLFVWMALSIWLGLQFGFLSILIPYNRPLKLPRILAIASVWVLLEWSRYFVLCGFTWNHSGLALSHPHAIQLASLFGILGLSFWVLFVNLLGLRAFLRKGIIHYLVWGAAACVPFFFGFMHMSYHNSQMQKPENRKTLSCALVQTGLLPSEKTLLRGKGHAFISPYDQWRRICSFLRERKGRPLDLIVLPEAVVPFSSNLYVYKEEEVKRIFFSVFGAKARQAFPEMELPYGKAKSRVVSNIYWIQALANLFSADVIAGLDHTDEDGLSYNSAFHAQPDKKMLNRYDKQVLMPLAEYLPFPSLAPLVSSYGITHFFEPGNGAKIFDGPVPLSVSICYEETFPQKIREGRRLGAELLVNVTNDGWYPFSRLPSQHYEHAKFRAVENGSALVRACNTGVTAAIDCLGRTVEKLKPYNNKKGIQAGVLFATMNIYQYPTLYTIWGNWGIVSLSLFFLIVFLILKKLGLSN